MIEHKGKRSNEENEKQGVATVTKEERDKIKQQEQDKLREIQQRMQQQQ